MTRQRSAAGADTSADTTVDATAGTTASNHSGGPIRGLADYLRAASDDVLAALLRARPDLSTPVPTDLSVLASRAQSRPSIARALERLNRFDLEVLDALRLQPVPASADDLVDLIQYGAPREAVVDVLTKLRTYALIWGDDDGIRVPTAVEEVVGPYPAGLGRTRAGLDGGSADDAANRLAEAPDSAREVALKLSAGPPIGAVRSARQTVSEPDRSPVRWLLTRGLLVAIDDNTVELPREVGLLLRGESPCGPLHPTAPRPDAKQLSEDAVNAGGSGQASEAVRLVEALLTAVAANAPGQLRAGGMGVREVRRLAKQIGVDDTTAALLLEISSAAQLLDCETDVDPKWLPTPEFDVWRDRTPAQRWRRLAAAWLHMQRLPHLVGQRDDRDRIVAVLSTEVTRTHAPVLRRDVLTALADLPAWSAPIPADIDAVVDWHRPRRADNGRTAAVEAVLAEAATLGITGRGALTSYGRLLMDGTDNAVVERLADLLPEPLDHVLVQPDLTVVAPGPLRPDLAAEIASVATVESAGAATVYRVSEESLRRALDAGWSAGRLHELFTSRSSTPIPQALTYLIDDTARRHGGVRAGAVGSYLRSEDEAALAELMADDLATVLRLRRIAPTVLVSPLGVDRLIADLRGGGYTPVPEDATGAIVFTRTTGARTSVRTRPIRPGADLPTLDDEQLATAVRGLRSGDELARKARQTTVSTVDLPGVTTASTLSTLQEAARTRTRVRLNFVDAHGGAAIRVVSPVSIGAGYLRAADERTDVLHTFALHRITAALPVEDDT